MRDHPQRQSQITRDVKVRFEADPNQSGFETNPDGGVDPAESGGVDPWLPSDPDHRPQGASLVLL